jgi:hypothetical protein
VPATYHDKSRSHTSKGTEMMFGPNERIGPEEPRVMGGHSLGSIVEVSVLDTVEDIGVRGAHCSVVLLRGRITRPTQAIGETM